jgi:hypothetical protein
MERTGSANLIPVLLKENEMSGHQTLARVRMIGVVRKEYNVQHLKTSRSDVGHPNYRAEK